MHHRGRKIGRSQALRAETAKGSYILLLGLPADDAINVGRRGRIRFRRGYYLYSGTAMGGLEARLRRHLRVVKKKFWHIDYLLEKASLIDVLTLISERNLECRLAGGLGWRLEPIAGFGCSDCQCRSHLFFGEEERQAWDAAREIADLVKAEYTGVSS